MELNYATTYDIVQALQVVCPAPLNVPLRGLMVIEPSRATDAIPGSYVVDPLQIEMTDDAVVEGRYSAGSLLTLE